MQISGAAKKKQHDSPRLNRHAAFFSSFFSGCLYRVHKLTSHFLHRPAKYCRRAAKPAKSVIFFRRISPLCWAAASGQVSPFRCSSHLSSEYPSLFYVFFACKTQSPPGRSRLASLSTNIICRIFSGMCYFFEIFLIFFCELFNRKFSILFIAYTFECYIKI